MYLGFFMKAKYSYIVSLLFFGFLAKGLFSLYHYTHDFRVDYISSSMSYHPEWDIKDRISSKEIKKILDQPFYFIGKGGQAYAFESQDGKYVLKFVKFKFIQEKLKNKLLSWIPFYEDYSVNERERRIKKFYDLYLGYKCAFEQNSQNSGIVYLHFNPTFSQFGSVALTDRKGLKHRVDLDQTAFIIQQKGIMLNDLLTQLLNGGHIEVAKQKIEKILDMYVTHYQMGLHDLGYGVIHNTGFVGDIPVHIDLGKMTWDEEIKNIDNYKPDLMIVTSKIEEWLNKTHPEYFPEISKFIEQKINSIFPSS